jgi:acylglycerol lipase
MEFSIKVCRDLRLKGDLYAPESKPSGIIVFIHGLGEHFARYSDWSSKFTDKGFVVIGIDLPGHGRSEGRRGHVKDYHEYNHIIESVAKFAVSKFGDLPIGLYGHSLGGNIILNYLLTNTFGFDFAIATSSWLELVSVPSKGTLAIARVVNHILPTILQPSGLHIEDISRSEEVNKKYENDPLIHGKVSVRLGIEATDAATRILDTGDVIDIPVLLLHGTDDRITSHKGSKKLAEINTKIRLKLWKDGYHELHNDPAFGEVFEYIYSWITKL